MQHNKTKMLLCFAALFENHSQNIDEYQDARLEFHTFKLVKHGNEYT